MNKFQNVSFNSIDEFLAYLPENERILVDLLREIIYECLPGVKEKLSYNVPYFSIHKRICFIWPASVPWGKVEKDGVTLGFCFGNLLEDPEEYLEKGTRKFVSTKTFKSPSEINIEFVKYFLLESLENDKLNRKPLKS